MQRAELAVVVVVAYPPGGERVRAVVLEAVLHQPVQLLDLLSHTRPGVSCHGRRINPCIRATRSSNPSWSTSRRVAPSAADVDLGTLGETSLRSVLFDATHCIGLS